MCITQDGKDFRKEINEIIRIKVTQKIGQFGLTRQDQGDLEQAVKCDLWRRWVHFRPGGSKPATFASRLVDNAILTVFEHRTAGKRNYHREAYSIDGTIPNRHGNGIQALSIDDRDGSRWLGLDQPHFTDCSDLALDVADLLIKLPDDLRELCVRLQTMSITEVARETGVPRGTLYDRLDLLKKFFREAGLDQYLPHSSGAFARRPVRNQQEQNDE